MSSKKLDYNGLQTLIQTIKSYISYYLSQGLSNYLPLSGGRITGDIVFTPNEVIDGEETGNGIFAASKYGIKGTNPTKPQFFSLFIARDDSNISSNLGTCRYGGFETELTADGTCKTKVSAYKNEANKDDRVLLTIVNPSSGDGYIQVSHHIRLNSNIEIY